MRFRADLSVDSIDLIAFPSLFVLVSFAFRGGRDVLVVRVSSGLEPLLQTGREDVMRPT